MQGRMFKLRSHLNRACLHAFWVDESTANQRLVLLFRGHTDGACRAGICPPEVHLRGILQAKGCVMCS
jgi:hypothetical protein